MTGRICVAVLWWCFGIVIASAQSGGRAPVHKADQISMSVDLSWNVRAAVTKFQQSDRLRLYKLASVRVTHCGVLYGLLGSVTTDDRATAEALKGASNVYYRAGMILWPDSADEHASMLRSAEGYLDKLRKDRSQVAAFLQGCKDLSSTEEAAYKIIASWHRGLGAN